MKKFKAFSTSAISLFMCGALGLSACGKGGDNSSTSEPTPQPADQQTITSVTGALGSLGTMVASGDTYKVVLTTDIAGWTMTYETNDSGNPIGDGVKEEGVIDFDGEAYFQFSETAMKVDAILNGGMTSNTAKESIYAAAYLRDDTIYAGMKESESAPLYFYEMALEDIMDMIQGGVKKDSAVEEDGSELTMETVAPDGPTVESFMTPEVMALVSKAAMNILVATEPTAVTKDGVTTLTVDVKAQLDYIYNTADAIVKGIKADTTLGALLDSASLKAFFNKYLGTITAAEVQAAIDSVVGEGTAPDVVDGQGAYEYIVAFVKDSFADQMTMPIGDPDIQGDITDAMTEVKAMLDCVKELSVSVSVKNNVFYGVGVSASIDAPEMMKLDISVGITMEAAEYTFTDVTTLPTAPAQAA